MIYGQVHVHMFRLVIKTDVVEMIHRFSLAGSSLDPSDRAASMAN